MINKCMVSLRPWLSPLEFFFPGLSTRGSVFLTPLFSTAEFETRYSQGKKVILYKKAKLEKWAPYLNENGLVKRLTVYADLDCKRDA